MIQLDRKTVDTSPLFCLSLHTEDQIPNCVIDVREVLLEQFFRLRMFGLLLLHLAEVPFQEQGLSAPWAWPRWAQPCGGAAPHAHRCQRGGAAPLQLTQQEL